MTKRSRVLILAAVVTGAGIGTVVAVDSARDNPSELLEARSGGDLTIDDASRNAFGLAARVLTGEERRRFEIGDSLFTQNWVTAPASTSRRDGLGPLFNAQACASCHVRDGRARPPDGPDDPERGLLFRLSLPDGAGRFITHPRYGDQLQDRAVLGVPPEGAMSITYQPITGRYSDGTAWELRSPIYRISDPAYGPVGDTATISPRVAQQVVGMGLLEAVPESDIEDAADPDDRDGNGISGRPGRVINRATGTMTLGRFGWKAGAATVADQTANAFAGDIGITSPTAPNQPCQPTQSDCARQKGGGVPEVSAREIATVRQYVATLAVPGRRNLDTPDVRRGADQFEAAGCGSCHTPTMRTGSSDIRVVANQTIHPYSDLLLHDMGPDLADDGADGNEWRTAPLWGIGLVERVNGHTRFMHDGRARNLNEAILWHGGEGASSRDYFINADRADRDAIVAFLESL